MLAARIALLQPHFEVLLDLVAKGYSARGLVLRRQPDVDGLRFEVNIGKANVTNFADARPTTLSDHECQHEKQVATLLDLLLQH